MNQKAFEYAYYQLQTLTDISSEAIAIIDKLGVVQYWNKHAEQIYSIASEDIVGSSINEFFLEKDLKLQEILLTQKPVSNVYHQPRKDKHVLISASPIYNQQHELIGAISIDHDITNTVKLNEKLTLTNRQLQKVQQEYNLEKKSGPLSEIKGNSTAIQKVKDLSLKVAKTNVTVLIQGESGVGKELFAHGIHAASTRNDKPFIPINCGAIPEGLFESELFGYEKGAFTGANKEGKAGNLEMADQGTLFLDEIGTLPLDMQVKLLRVLQEKEVYRIGSSERREVNIRVVAATNSYLEEKVKNGEFRDDLYYRLNVVTLRVPPLRERIDDIPVLIDYFLQEFAIEYQTKVPKLLPDALNYFMQHTWPGNARELRNSMERLTILNDKLELTANDVEDLFPNMKNTAHDYNTQEMISEKELIQQVLSETYGNKSAAAKKLGISRPSLYKKIKKYGI